jgi:hypothetical protein
VIIELHASSKKRARDYDYDYVYLDHKHTIYSQSTATEYGVKYLIQNEWQIYEHNELPFIITHLSGDTIEYVDLHECPSRNPSEHR